MTSVESRVVANWSLKAGSVLVPLLLLLFARHAHANDVEENSLANRLYVLLWHSGADTFNVSQLVVTLPSCCSGVASIYEPTEVPADSGRLAVFEFDVDPGALGLSQLAAVTITGTTDGSPVQMILNVPLNVVADAPPPATVNDGDFGNETTDTDGDGVANWVEVLFGSNPFDPGSMPGMKMVPAVAPPGLVLLAVLLALLALPVIWVRRRQRVEL